MRSVLVVVNCDWCKNKIEETTEGSNTVTFTVGGKQWQMELCYPCLGSKSFENAREIKKKGRPPGTRARKVTE